MECSAISSDADAQELSLSIDWEQEHLQAHFTTAADCPLLSYNSTDRIENVIDRSSSLQLLLLRIGR